MGVELPVAQVAGGHQDKDPGLQLESSLRDPESGGIGIVLQDNQNT